MGVAVTRLHTGKRVKREEICVYLDLLARGRSCRAAGGKYAH
ncbi:hypothetical protein [Methanothrix sp.]|nr:hypothetical protein [Methanothrix sp.]